MPRDRTLNTELSTQEHPAMPERETRHHDHPERIARARQFRQPMTATEARLWHHVRDRRCGGYKIRRQVVIGVYIVDFLCAEAKVIIEIDGESHTGRIEYDQTRTEYLQSQGYTVVRFTNDDVRERLEGVLIRIAEHCAP